MKTYNHLYQNRRNFESFLNGTGLDKSKPSLVRIHSCIHTAEEISLLAAEITELLPNSKLIGCSTSGVICEGEIIEDACLISISTFDKCIIDTYSDSCENEKKLCKELSEKLIKGRNGFLLLFLPVSFTKGIKLAELMNTKNPGVMIMGGTAARKSKKHNAYTLEGSCVSDKAASAAFISSDSLYTYENFICGAESSGKKFTVTKFHNRRIESVDDIDGVKWYSRYLDKEELEKDPDLSLLFPIMRITDIDIPFLVKYNHKKEPSLNLCCDLPKSSQISMGFFNPQKTLDEMRSFYSDLKDKPTESFFAYDCQATNVC